MPSSNPGLAVSTVHNIQPLTGHRLTDVELLYPSQDILSNLTRVYQSGVGQLYQSNGTSLVAIVAGGGGALTILANSISQGTASSLNYPANTVSVVGGVANIVQGPVSTANLPVNLQGWVDVVSDYNAAGITTTTTGSIASGTNSLTVASATGLAVGQGVAVAGAGTGGSAGTELVSTITAISGTTLTLSANATATVSNATVSHDDTAAIQAAFNSGKNVKFGLGNFNVSSQITVANALWVMGSGTRGRNVAGIETLTTMGTVILNRATTTNIFVITIGDVQFSNFSVEQTVGLTPTAGYAFVYTSGTRLLNCRMNDVFIFGTAAGISVGTSAAGGAVSASWFTRVNAWVRGSTSTAALYVNNPSPNGDLDFTDCDFRGSLGTPGLGIYIVATDTMAFNSCKVNSSDPCLKIDDLGANTIVNIRFNNCSFEGLSAANTTHNVLVNSTLNGGVSGLTWNGGEVGFNTGTGTSGMIINGFAINCIVNGMIFHSLSQGFQSTSTNGRITVSNCAFDTITNSNINPNSTPNFQSFGNVFDGSGSQLAGNDLTVPSVLFAGTVLNNPRLGIGTLSPTQDASFGGSVARVINVERNPTAATAGNSLTVQAGGGTSAGTNLAGGDLVLRSGIATGTGVSGVNLQANPAGTTGATDTTPTTVLRVDGTLHALYKGTTPTIASGGGTSPSIAGVDQALQITVGSGGSATSVAVTYGKAWLTAPIVVASSSADPALTVTSTTTGFTITKATALTAASTIAVMSAGF